MKLIEPKVEELKQEDGIQGIYKIIDEVAGVCYGRTEPHEDPKDFVENTIIKKKHYRALEFATVYLKIPANDKEKHIIFNDVMNSVYSKKVTCNTNNYVTTNLRVLIENRFTVSHPSVIQCLCNYHDEPELFFKRPILKLTCSRAIADELSRAIADELRTHITLSSMMRSTRYYKFKEGLQCVKPFWYQKPDGYKERTWRHAMSDAEENYQLMTANGFTTQEARGTLPLDMATELIMCGYKDNLNDGWQRLLNLRSQPTAHPDAQYLSKLIKDVLYPANIYKSDK